MIAASCELHIVSSTTSATPCANNSEGIEWNRNRRLYGTAPSHAGVIAFSPSPPSVNKCIADPRLKVKMAPERQDKDKHTHVEVGFEHPARAKNTCDECAHFIRGSLGGWHVGGCELVKDPIEPQDWCNKFNASLVKPLKTLKLTSRLTPIGAWISTAAYATLGPSVRFLTHQKRRHSESPRSSSLSCWVRHGRKAMSN